MLCMTKLKRYRRIKRYIIVLAIIGIHLNASTSKYFIFLTQFRCTIGTQRLFVEGRSANGGIYDHQHQYTSTASEESKTSSKSKQNIVNDSIVVSNVLQRHRTYYNNRLPHNHYIYDILQVPHNATLQQIKHSYRTDRKSVV